MNWKTVLVTGIIVLLVAALALVVYKAESNPSADEQAEIDVNERIRVMRLVDEDLALKRRILENQIWHAQMKAKMQPAQNPIPAPLVPPTPIDPNKTD